MGNHMGTKLDYKQETSSDIMARAKAECRFSARLYDILITHQERHHDRKYKPLEESERVGELCLPLSRLYNEIWSEVMGFSYKGTKTHKEIAA